MKNFFLYFLFIFSCLFHSNVSFTQETGLKGIIKKQQDKIQLIENNLKSLVGALENKDTNKLEGKDTIRITIVGQPNVGKSTLYNLLYGKNRVITAPISGTTRDSILSSIQYKNYNFDLIDTAVSIKSKL